MPVLGLCSVCTVLGPQWAHGQENEQTRGSGVGEISVGWAGPASLCGGKSYGGEKPARLGQPEERLPCPRHPCVIHQVPVNQCRSHTMSEAP